MQPVESSEKIIDVDIVLIAAGFIGAENQVTKAFGVNVTKKGSVADIDYHTNVDKIYVAGDMRRGQSLVVWAIKEGREVAKVIDTDLMGYSNL